MPLFLSIAGAEDNDGLSRENFKKISKNGFGDPANSYAWSMTWFQDRLYVGTGRDFLCAGHWIRELKGTVIDGPLQDAVECNENPPDFPENFASEIWCYTPDDEEKWKMVYKSPLVTVTVKGKDYTLPRDFGYRGMAVFTGSDGQEVLLVGTYSLPRMANILQTKDGINFTETDPAVYGRPAIFKDVMSFRSLINFKGKLYMTPTSTSGDGNISEVVRVFESEDPVNGIWYPVSRNSFGRRDNLTIFELGVFNNCLYAGTGNAQQGFQIWKTDAKGDAIPYHWNLVVDKGAGRGPRNEGAVSMCAFKDYLYVGSGVQHGGYDFENEVPFSCAELIRIKSDDTWELVVGDRRRVKGEVISPISGFRAGFGNIFNGYFWRMVEYKGWLYLGTYDSSVFLPYFEEYFSPSQQEIVKYFSEKNGGFDLWKSSDGIIWDRISHNGFNNTFNYGIRTFAATPAGLFLGTANPFKDKEPETGKPRAGGLEIWQGN
ncbi:MAG: hypothetical protein SV062_04570 [Thermodesulfobacteriota bacterium]|nr:hypothetical protein [Thermodesulfobacteriota bacterium]